MAIVGSLFVLWRPLRADDSGAISCSGENLFAERCQPVFYTLGRLQVVAIVLAAVVLYGCFL